MDTSINQDTVGTKAERCVLNAPLSPQQISQSQLELARAAMDAFFLETTQDDVQPSVEDTTLDEAKEQSKDSEQSNERKNPQARGRLKPTRKGNP
jgi:hypothetical protein